MMKKNCSIIFLFALFFLNFSCLGVSSLPLLKDGMSPQNLDELWAGYDPRIEPLDVEILEEWEDDGIVCRVIRYRVGIFKDKKAMMGAIYGFPKGGKNLPGLVQIHGGGQHANLNAVTTNARRGYACISLNWLGNQMTGLREGKGWKWEGIHTDWGHVDATQNTHNSHFGSLEPDDKTIDDIESPRNNNWFLGIIAARRAVTFLQQQPEVDASKIGIYGHSMGAKLTFDTAAIDKRVKAAAPSCGAQPNDSKGLYGKTIATYAYTPLMTCPVIFIDPSDDFHGTIDGIEKTIGRLNSVEYRLNRIPHLNHRTYPDGAVCTLLWFDQYLKGTFEFPRDPMIAVDIKTYDGLPRAFLKPDTSKRILDVDVYFSRCDCKPDSRYWELANIEKEGNIWIAKCPVLSTDKPLRVYAYVLYPLKKSVTGASFYYQIYTAKTFSLASRMYTFEPDDLKAAGVRATEHPTNIIEDFGNNWKKKWYVHNYDGQWPYRSHKLKDTKYQAPSPDCKMAIDIKCKKYNCFSIELDNYKTNIPVTGGSKWQTVVLRPQDFKLKEQKDKNKKQNKPETLQQWTNFKELVIGPCQSAFPGQPEVEVGKGWQGALPEFRNLRWIEIAADEFKLHRPNRLIKTGKRPL